MLVFVALGVGVAGVVIDVPRAYAGGMRLGVPCPLPLPLPFPFPFDLPWVTAAVEGCCAGDAGGAPCAGSLLFDIAPPLTDQEVRRAQRPAQTNQTPERIKAPRPRVPPSIPAPRGRRQSQ